MKKIILMFLVFTTLALSQEGDTLATWRHIWQDDITTYGDWDFKGTTTLSGATTATGNYTATGTTTFRNTFSIFDSGNIAFSNTGTFLIGSSAFDITAPTDFTDELVTFNDSVLFLATSTVIMSGNITIDGDISFNAITINTPEVIGLVIGSQTISIRKSFIVIDGNVLPSAISDFTGKDIDGNMITVLCDPSDGDGFTILDGVPIVCHGGNSISMTAGDVVEFVYYSGKWYQRAPSANNN